MLRLADMYDATELPTRPGTPTAKAARPCLDCGKVYGEHVISRPPGLLAHVVNAPCFGLRRNFRDAASSEADRER